MRSLRFSLLWIVGLLCAGVLASVDPVVAGESGNSCLNCDETYSGGGNWYFECVEARLDETGSPYCTGGGLNSPCQFSMQTCHAEPFWCNAYPWWPECRSSSASAYPVRAVTVASVDDNKWTSSVPTSDGFMVTAARTSLAYNDGLGRVFAVQPPCPKALGIGLRSYSAISGARIRRSTTAVSL